MSTPPRWDMNNIYPSLESKEFEAAVKDYKRQAASFKNFFDKKLSKAGPKTKAKDLAPLVGQAITRLNKIQTLSDTIGPFIYAYVTTDSRNQAAMKALSEFEQAGLPMDKAFTRFRMPCDRERMGALSRSPKWTSVSIAWAERVASCWVNP